MDLCRRRSGPSLQAVPLHCKFTYYPLKESFLALYTATDPDSLVATSATFGVHVLVMPSSKEKGRHAMDRPLLLSVTCRSKSDSNLVAELLARSGGQQRSTRVVCDFFCKWVFGPAMLAILHAGLVVFWLRNDTEASVFATPAFDATRIPATTLTTTEYIPNMVPEGFSWNAEEERDELGNPYLELWQRSVVSANSSNNASYNVSGRLNTSSSLDGMSTGVPEVSSMDSGLGPSSNAPVTTSRVQSLGLGSPPSIPPASQNPSFGLDLRGTRSYPMCLRTRCPRQALT